jgi:hypothetical protein
MKYRIVVGALALAMLVGSGRSADEPLKSSLPVGSKKITPFNPLHCSGEGEGTKACLV